MANARCLCIRVVHEHGGNLDIGVAWWHVKPLNSQAGIVQAQQPPISKLLQANE